MGGRLGGGDGQNGKARGCACSE
jgi:hypothetical protein